jgi:hypothetical protein
MSNTTNINIRVDEDLKKKAILYRRSRFLFFIRTLGTGMKILILQ